MTASARQNAHVASRYLAIAAAVMLGSLALPGVPANAEHVDPLVAARHHAQLQAARETVSQAVDRSLLSDTQAHVASGQLLGTGSTDQWSDREMVHATRTWPSPTGTAWVAIRGYPTAQQAATAYARAAQDSGLGSTPEVLVARTAGSTAVAIQMGNALIAAGCDGSSSESEACALRLLHAQADNWTEATSHGLARETLNFPTQRQLRKAILTAGQAVAATGSAPATRHWVGSGGFPLAGSVVAAYQRTTRNDQEAQAAARTPAGETTAVEMSAKEATAVEMTAVAAFGSKARAKRAWAGALDRLTKAGWQVGTQDGSTATLSYANADSSSQTKARIAIAGSLLVLTSCLEDHDTSTEGRTPAQQCADQLHAAQVRELRKARLT